jgi:hypothetical protein
MASHATSDGRYTRRWILSAATPPRRVIPKSPDRCSGSDRSLNWGRQRQVDKTYQRSQNMDPTNPPPAKPFRAGSDEAGSTRARTWNIILLHIPDTLPSAGTGTDINATHSAC